MEWIKQNEKVMALIIPSIYTPVSTEFVTPDSY